MKTGLVMEGGAMRGLFTAGVLDVFMENGITFDGAIGVSAGATFGCNIKSHQIGRCLRYNKIYCSDPRYASLRSWMTTGDLYNAEFCYRTLPNELDLFDTETFEKNPMEFYVVATDCKTGIPVYKKMTDGKDHDVQWIRASASMPVASRPVELDGYVLLDGGMADAIPVKKMEELGYDRIVIIETREKSYVKKKQKMLPAIALVTRKYPAVAKTLSRRHIMYNRRTAYIRQKEAAGEFLVIRPPKALNIGSTEKNPDELQRVYDIGRQAALEKLEEVRSFLQPDKTEGQPAPDRSNPEQARPDQSPRDPLHHEVREKYRRITRELIKKQMTITTMESATSGQIASLITDTEGSSAIMKGAFVTYSNEAKIKQGVPAETIKTYGVYSAQTASAMATVCRHTYQADIGIGVTGTMGNADPANRDSVPGQVYFAMDYRGNVRNFYRELPPQPSRLDYKMRVADAIADEILALLSEI